MVAKGDINAYLKKIRAAGAWGIRFFLLQSWSTKLLLPWKQAVYNGVPVHTVIPSEGVDAPVCDLNQENTEYWERLGVILAMIKANDLEAVVSLGDNCSQNTHQQFFTYPFLGGLQTMSKEEGWPFVLPQEALSMFTASRGGLYGPDKYPYFKDWVSEAVIQVNQSGVAYRVEIQNEFSRLTWTDSTPENWWKMCYEETNLAASKHLNSGDWQIISKYPGIYSQHGVAKPQFNPVPIEKSRILLSGDGAQGNSTTDIDVMGRHGLSVDDAKSLAAIIREQGYAGYEAMNKATWSKDDCLADVDDATFEVFDAMYKSA
jgi:hypothetical protein